MWREIKGVGPLKFRLSVGRLVARGGMSWDEEMVSGMI